MPCCGEGRSKAARDAAASGGAWKSRVARGRIKFNPLSFPIALWAPGLLALAAWIWIVIAIIKLIFR